ncbi:hypothetical protein [Chryseobacterium viscerum]|uniref:PBCV-specific basic adaptor domain-containing protein n=1 Tax=Chryseobacterium viscerum TaxID=1037377 RepID=A0A5N4BK56_9FLAO|nr:hypothetical protein [Chryseobacterium viscerum]KAB1228800.1 hypothetical protein F8D52_20725 [Chryseobacterium viscerum]
MKKLLFTSLLGLGLLLPANFSASTSTTVFAKELSGKKPRKSKSKSSRKSRTTGSASSGYSRAYSSSKGCTYNGQQLYVGSRGGCYYYSGSSKKYVDRSYCSGCN